MEGDDRTRFCGQCKLNVYNVSSLSDQETVKLMRGAQDTQERLCLRLYRRTDGTIITDNCPVGLRKIRDRIKLRVAMILALLASIGFINAVQAQGLVGAPVEAGRLGQSNEIADITTPITNIDFNVLSRSTLTTAAIWLAANRRASFTILGIGLTVILFLAGVFTGLCSEHYIWCR